MVRPNMRYIVLMALGLALCVVPVAVAILCYFPVWTREGSGSVICGFTVLLLALAALPFHKAIKRFLSGASIYTVWLLAFILFFCLSSIAEEMTVISFVGFVSNMLGAVCLRISKSRGDEK